MGIVRSAPLVLVLLCAGCLDFGYRIAPAELSEPDSGPSMAPAACEEGAVPPSDVGVQVQLISLNTDRPVLEISAGEVVTWTNTDTMAHTATAGTPEAELPIDQGGFSSPLLAQGDRWAWRFCSPRQLLWFCRTHPAQMRDYRLVVR